MKVTLTGATGFVGSHVLTELLEHGHEVLALVRNGDQADTVAARGATPIVPDLYDHRTTVALLRGADGAIHTASPGDETSADLDTAVVEAAIEAFADTGKPYLQISGLWISETTPRSPRSPHSKRRRSARASSTGRQSTSPTSRTSSGAYWRTTRLGAAS